jgi:putative hydrolase of the HAD superfamily
MTRAILSDVGGVVLHLDWQAAAAHWEAELGLRPGGFLDAMFGGNDDTVLIGRVSEDEWWREVCRRLSGGCGGVPPAALRARFEVYHNERERCDVEMAQFLGSLRAGHRVALVSNIWPSTCARVRTHWRLHELCDEMIFSCEVGVAKPHEGIYRIACERLGIPPNEAVFIDDARENVAAAAALGMRAVHFHDTRRAIDEVSRLLAEG